jgi:Sap, sulfolipid-1-addressing protein
MFFCSSQRRIVARELAVRRLLPVTGTWGAALSKLIPLALVIALSPLSVIPAVLVLHAPRPRPSSLAFLGGWLVGLTALTALFVAASDLLGGMPKSPPTWASWLRVVLGSVLIVFGIVRWLTRRSHTETPAWMRSFEKLTPVRAGLTGAVLVVVRPEVLILCAVAGLAIGTGGLGVVGVWVSGAVFVALAASTVAIPVLAYAAAGDRLDDRLARLKDWMEKNNAALLAVILVLIGLMVLYNGIHAL